MVTGSLYCGLIVQSLATDGNTPPTRRRVDTDSPSFPMPFMRVQHDARNPTGDVVQRFFANGLELEDGQSHEFNLVGELPNDFGTLIDFALIHFILIVVNEPDGVKYLIAGPSPTNPFSGPFATADSQIEIFEFQPFPNSIAGWPVSPTEGTAFHVSNISGQTVNYSIMIVGRE